MYFTQQILTSQKTKYYYTSPAQNRKIIIFDDPLGSETLWIPVQKSFHEYQIVILPFNLTPDEIEHIFTQELNGKALAIAFGQGNHTLLHNFDRFATAISGVVSLAPLLKTTRSLLPAPLQALPELVINRKKGVLIRELVNLIPFKGQILKNLRIFTPYIDNKLLEQYCSDLLSHPWMRGFAKTPLRWKTVPVPTLLIAGDRDPLLPGEQLPDGGEQLIITRGGRLAFWEFYDLSTLRIKKFIRDHRL